MLITIALAYVALVTYIVATGTKLQTMSKRRRGVK